MDTFSGSADAEYDPHIETLVPVRVQSLLDDTSCVRLLSVDRDDRERVRKTEDLAF